MDTSVWIDHLRNRSGLPHISRLRAAFGKESILVGDIILLEVLQGVSDEIRATEVERLLRSFVVVRMLDDELPVRAARNYRTLRSRGLTVRKSIGMIIGTFCLERGVPLLHNDADFQAMKQHLPLAVIAA